MKKTLVALTLFGLLVSTPALAGNGNKDRGGDDNNRNRSGMVRNNRVEKNNDSRFIVSGTVESVSSASLVLTVKENKGGFFGWFHRGKNNDDNGLTGSVTINTDSNTKVTKDKESVDFDTIAKGDGISVSGSKTDDNKVLASNIKINTRGAIAGQVTAKTDNSVTIKNNVTGETKTITTDADTKISINGEEQAVSDIQVGDKGFVKFKKTVNGIVAKFVGLFR